MIQIDFENVYSPISVADDLSFMSFSSPLRNGTSEFLVVKLDPSTNPLLPGVYNLCFGPLNASGHIDDNIQLHHQDVGKVFSTILLYGLTFLNRFPGRTIGIDGSSDSRAYYYHRVILTNASYLEAYFSIIGLDWMLRLLRNQEVKCDENGNPFIVFNSEPFDCQRSTRDLYRYYMFRLKN